MLSRPNTPVFCSFSALFFLFAKDEEQHGACSHQYHTCGGKQDGTHASGDGQLESVVIFHSQRYKAGDNVGIGHFSIQRVFFGVRNCYGYRSI